jgi:hypothetical protein
MASNLLINLKYKNFIKSPNDLKNKSALRLRYNNYVSDLKNSDPNGLTRELLLLNMSFDTILPRTLFDHIQENSKKMYNELLYGLDRPRGVDPYIFLSENFYKVPFRVKNNLIKTYYTSVTISFISLLISDMENFSMDATTVVDRLEDIKNRLYGEIEFRDFESYTFLTEKGETDFGHFIYRSSLRIEVDNLDFWIDKIKNMLSKSRRDFILINPNSTNKNIIDFFNSLRISLLMIQSNIKKSTHNLMSEDYITGFV